jgi:hypothetical protein
MNPEQAPPSGHVTYTTVQISGRKICGLNKRQQIVSQAGQRHLNNNNNNKIPVRSYLKLYIEWEPG